MRDTAAVAAWAAALLERREPLSAGFGTAADGFGAGTLAAGGAGALVADGASALAAGGAGTLAAGGAGTLAARCCTAGAALAVASSTAREHADAAASSMVRLPKEESRGCLGARAPAAASPHARFGSEAAPAPSPMLEEASGTGAHSAGLGLRAAAVALSRAA